MSKLTKRFSLIKLFRTIERHFILIILIMLIAGGSSGAVYMLTNNGNKYTASGTISNRFLITSTALDVIKTNVTSEQVFNKVIKSFPANYVTHQELLDNLNCTTDTSIYGYTLSFSSTDAEKSVKVLNSALIHAVSVCNEISELSQNGFFVKNEAHSATRDRNISFLASIIVVNVMTLIFVISILHVYDQRNMIALSPEDYRENDISLIKCKIVVEKQENK